MSKFSNIQKDNIKENTKKEGKPVKEKQAKKPLFGGLFKKKEKTIADDIDDILEENDTTPIKQNKTLLQGVFLYAPSQIYEETFNIINKYDYIELTGCSDSKIIQNNYSDAISPTIILIITQTKDCDNICNFIKSLSLQTLPEKSLDINIAVTSEVEPILIPELKKIKGISKFANIFKTNGKEVPVSLIPDLVSTVIKKQPTHIEKSNKTIQKVPVMTNKAEPPFNTSLSTIKNSLNRITANQDLSKDIANIINELAGSNSKEDIEGALMRGSETYRAISEIANETLNSINNMSNIPNHSKKELNNANLAYISACVSKSNTANSIIQEIVTTTIDEAKKIKHEINECLRADLEIANGMEANTNLLLEQRSNLRETVETYVKKFKELAVVSQRAIMSHTKEIMAINDSLSELIQNNVIDSDSINIAISVVKSLKENVIASANSKEEIKRIFEETLSLASNVIDIQQKLIQLDDEIIFSLVTNKEHLQNMIKTHTNKSIPNIPDSRFKEKCSLIYLTQGNTIYDILKYSLKENDMIIHCDNSHKVYTQNPITLEEFISADVNKFKNTTEPVEIKIKANTPISEEDIIPRLEYLSTYKRTIYVLLDCNSPASFVENIFLSNTQIAIITCDLNGVDNSQEISNTRFKIVQNLNILFKKLLVTNFNATTQLSSLENLKSLSGVTVDSWDIIKVPPLPLLQDIPISNKIEVAERVAEYMRL